MSSEFGYGKGSIHLNAAYTDYESVANDTFGESVTKGSNWVLDVYNKYVFGEQFYTILGVNYIKDEAIFADEVDFTIVDPYANMVYVSDFGFNLNAGARLNNHSEYGNHFVYNVNPSYVFDTENGYVKLMGSYATSYITPNLTQLFGAFGGNPALEPEENSTIEGGIEFKLNNSFRISTVYFDRNETNTIGYDANFMSINVADEINANGVEVEATWLPLANLSFNVNYTFTERKGDNAIRIPKHKANVSLWYRFCESTDASLTYAYTGERFDTDFTTFSDLALEPFSLLNISIRHELINNKLNVFLNVDNLLNEDYRELLGFTTRGRNFRVGLNLNL